MDSLPSESPSLATPVKNQPQVDMGPAVVTPDRFNNPPSRIRNQNSALSLSDVRRTALQLRKPNPTSWGCGSGSGQVLNRVGSSAPTVNVSNKSSTLLPQKYEMLCELFNAMVSAIRLLRLKQIPSTLTKLSRNIESLTDRRFSLHHLAQLKHIVPEVIAVKKIRVKDEETSCMKEDLLISLETDKISNGSAGYSHLKAIFHSRIIDYAMIHPEGLDVQEGELPEMFYKQPKPSMNQTSALQPTTLTAPSFKRRFSSRVSKPSLAKAFSGTHIEEAASVTMPVEVVTASGKCPLTPAKCVYNPAMILSTPAKIDSSPSEAVSTPGRLMSATPALCTPKSILITDDATTDLPKKSAKRRALRFEENSYDAEDQPCQENSEESSCKDLMGVLPEDLLLSLMDKERRTLEDQDPVLSQARKRQQLMAGVPKLFDMVKLLFQSIRRSVMTREELIHKIITGHLDIVDRREVEEQLKLLQEVAPEFIGEQTCLSGDILLRLNKLSCAESIRAKLLEAQ